MGNAEGLVQVEVTHISPIKTWLGQAHLGIEVGAIEIHLAAVLMHQGADLLDPLLKDSVGGGIGDHQRGQLSAMGFHLGRQIGAVDVALGVASHRHHPQARHHGAGGVGAMGAGGDQAHRALLITPAVVPGADHQQTRIFPL